MADMMKVIKGITHHKLGLCDMSGKICPYWEEEADCMRKMLGDALALLKEQEEQKFFVDESGKITPLPVVVRCKDCKYGKKISDGVYCRKGIGDVETKSAEHDPEWFCGGGEKA